MMTKRKKSEEFGGYQIFIPKGFQLATLEENIKLKSEKGYFIKGENLIDLKVENCAIGEIIDEDFYYAYFKDQIVKTSILVDSDKHAMKGLIKSIKSKNKNE